MLDADLYVLLSLADIAKMEAATLRAILDSDAMADHTRMIESERAALAKREGQAAIDLQNQLTAQLQALVELSSPKQAVSGKVHTQTRCGFFPSMLSYHSSFIYRVQGAVVLGSSRYKA